MQALYYVAHNKYIPSQGPVCSPLRQSAMNANSYIPITLIIAESISIMDVSEFEKLPLSVHLTFEELLQSSVFTFH